MLNPDAFQFYFIEENDFAYYERMVISFISSQDIQLFSRRACVETPVNCTGWNDKKDLGFKVNLLSKLNRDVKQNK
jgi:hypothetical protein